MDKNIRQALLKNETMVPRYTSYPTAPHFRQGADAGWYGERLAAVPSGSNISVYVHVPFCPKLCWFCGCHTRITNRYDAVEDYVASLVKEFSLVLEHIPAQALNLSHIHFGGGSPTILHAEDFTRIANIIKGHFKISEKTEFSIEVDPRNITKEKVKAYARAGINRASFGIQDFDDKVMASVNREQSFETDFRAISLFRDQGIEKLNIDLMYGLPHQTQDTMKECTEKALRLSPDRISLFGYAHVPWMKKHMRLIPEDRLPNPEERLDLFELAASTFEDQGYLPIGIDHFALPDDKLSNALREGRLHRNFQGYTDDECQYLLGFGASAIGYLKDSYVQNYVFLPQYRDCLIEEILPIDKSYTLTDQDRLRAAIIERLMCDLSVNPLAIAESMGIEDNQLERSYDRLEPLVKDGLVLLNSEGTVHVLVRQAARLACAAFDVQFEGEQVKRHATSS